MHNKDNENQDKSLIHYMEKVSEHERVRRGFSTPLGAHVYGDGVNFSLFSRHATAVRLEFFNQPGDEKPTFFFDLDPNINRSGDIWHIWIANVKSGQLYGYRLDGPYAPQAGHRFNWQKLLIDPYATAITNIFPWRFITACDSDNTFSQEDDTSQLPKCIFCLDHFDWCDDKPLRYPWSDAIIYETHVRGLTIDKSAHAQNPGTYKGVIEKIPYFKKLGITIIELMPVQEFNSNQASIFPVPDPIIKNYWGYDPVAFLAPKASYSSAGGLGQQKLEFKEMVLALHQAGIEVILDVVFNHTGEGNSLGPTISLRGIDNRIYYILDENGDYKDFTGTGNTIKSNHPVVHEYILAALRYWVLEMHIDGFRFDLAAILGRSGEGVFLKEFSLIDMITEDPILRHVKLIAEAWDISNDYAIGHFSRLSWSEWNGAYRDDVRAFWRGDDGKLGVFAQRLSGSQDLYYSKDAGPQQSINYVTSHDGFTLNDLVSYTKKHNESNGQNNLDGTDLNYSENFGIEGESTDPVIESNRAKQIKNFILTLMVSRGVPMILGGDEFRRTQYGNNNAFCQDNEMSWYNWELLAKNVGIFNFFQKMIAFRKQHPVLSMQSFYDSIQIRWLDPNGETPEWQNPQAKCLGLLIQESPHQYLFLMFNANPFNVKYKIPRLENIAWYLEEDTNIANFTNADSVLESPDFYELAARSSVILKTKTPL